mmetsp:Transcript_43043/g.131072  ORF Transcript_43043/g.131072 Transcript_43043/m.131072 type:complete len:183 (+) Transcript_43043:421-969(+)
MQILVLSLSFSLLKKVGPLFDTSDGPKRDTASRLRISFSIIFVSRPQVYQHIEQPLQRQQSGIEKLKQKKRFFVCEFKYPLQGWEEPCYVESTDIKYTLEGNLFGPVSSGPRHGTLDARTGIFRVRNNRLLSLAHRPPQHGHYGRYENDARPNGPEEEGPSPRIIGLWWLNVDPTQPLHAIV